MVLSPSKIVAQHDRLRQRCLNLIASENVLSPAARKALASDMATRYAFRPEFYSGTSKIHEIWSLAEQLGKEVFIWVSGYDGPAIIYSTPNGVPLGRFVEREINITVSPKPDVPVGRLKAELRLIAILYTICIVFV